MESHRIAVTDQAIVELCALLEECIAGRSLGYFRRHFKSFAERHDWQWFGLRPQKDFNRRCLWLYRAVIYSRYCADRQTELHKAGFPIWIFRSGIDCSRKHNELDGIALPPGDPFWRYFSPPLGWICGCYIVGVRSERMIHRLGIDPSKTPPEWWNKVDPVTGLRSGIDPLWDKEESPDLLTILAAIVDGHTSHLE